MKVLQALPRKVILIFQTQSVMIMMVLTSAMNRDSTESLLGNGALVLCEGRFNKQEMREKLTVSGKSLQELYQIEKRGQSPQLVAQGPS